MTSLQQTKITSRAPPGAQTCRLPLYTNVAVHLDFCASVVVVGHVHTSAPQRVPVAFISPSLADQFSPSVAAPPPPPPAVVAVAVAVASAAAPAAIASGVPYQSGHTFVPWWMSPTILEHIMIR